MRLLLSCVFLPKGGLESETSTSSASGPLNESPIMNDVMTPVPPCEIGYSSFAQYIIEMGDESMSLYLYFFIFDQCRCIALLIIITLIVIEIIIPKGSYTTVIDRAIRLHRFPAPQY